jgi:hypothetical protein
MEGERKAAYLPNDTGIIQRKMIYILGTLPDGLIPDFQINPLLKDPKYLKQMIIDYDEDGMPELVSV